MILRPAGPRSFQTDDAPLLAAWMRSQGATSTEDGRLELGAGWVRIAEDGQVTIGGDGWEGLDRLLVFACTEGNIL